MQKSVHSAEQKVLQDILIEARKEKGLRQDDLAQLLDRPQPFVSRYESGEKMLDLPELRQVCEALGVSLTQFVVQYEKAVKALKGSARPVRDSLSFIVADKRPSDQMRYTRPGDDEEHSLTVSQVEQAMVAANQVLELIYDLSEANNAPVFKLLGLRNLSGFVGEVFASELCRLNEDEFLPNPNQDGYPDLLALTIEGKAYIEKREAQGQTTDKAFWSPYPHGGVEVKATCGNTPPAKTLAKPTVGEPRRQILESAEWKAHHQNTNNLLGMYWDFVDKIPMLLAAFYCNDLTQDDWGKVVQYKADGGNSTSVSVMKKGKSSTTGVKKMGQGWLVLPADPEFRHCLCKDKVFAVSDADIVRSTSAVIPS